MHMHMFKSSFFKISHQFMYGCMLSMKNEMNLYLLLHLHKYNRSFRLVNLSL